MRQHAPAGSADRRNSAEIRREKAENFSQTFLSGLLFLEYILNMFRLRISPLVSSGICI